MVRLRVSWPFSLSSAPTVGNPCRPLQPESVSCTASRKIRSFRPLAPRRERQARNTSSTVAQSSSVIRVSMVGSSQTDLPSVTDPRTWESTHCILSPIRPHGLAHRRQLGLESVGHLTAKEIYVAFCLFCKGLEDIPRHRQLGAGLGGEGQ